MSKRQASCIRQEPSEPARMIAQRKLPSHHADIRRSPWTTIRAGIRFELRTFDMNWLVGGRSQRGRILSA